MRPSNSGGRTVDPDGQSAPQLAQKASLDFWATPEMVR
jgi:hypothetical protein